LLHHAGVFILFACVHKAVEFKLCLNSNSFVLLGNRIEIGRKTNPTGPKTKTQPNSNPTRRPVLFPAQPHPALPLLSAPAQFLARRLARSPPRGHTCASPFSRTTRPTPQAQLAPACSRSTRSPSRASPARCAPGPARQRHSRSAARHTDGPGPPASSVSPASPGRATARHDSRPGDLAGLPIRARTPRSPALPFLTPAAPLRRHPIPLAPHKP